MALSLGKKQKHVEQDTEQLSLGELQGRDNTMLGKDRQELARGHWYQRMGKQGFRGISRGRKKMHQRENVPTLQV